MVEYHMLDSRLKEEESKIRGEFLCGTQRNLCFILFVEPYRGSRSCEFNHEKNSRYGSRSRP
jgi:hypothetical protein